MKKTKTTQEFEKAYAQLNPEQKKAVDTIDGPLMVVAGPGTGKTQTIALRIANILVQTDTDPDAILALTFTESGARAMRTRLSQMIGTPAYYVNINTFHGFCVGVMKDNPDSFFIDPSAEPLSDLEKLRIVYRLIDTLNLSLLRPVNAPYHYARAIIGALSDLKREGVGPDKLSDLLDIEEAFLSSDESEELKKTERTKRTRNLGKNRELHRLYEQYQQELDKTKRFDFEDMINSVVEAFKTNPNLLSAYQERFQYLLVDEYQDTNSSQNELLLQLASFWGDKANIMVTGDPDQSIMRFQGASIENQLGFINNFPGATVITLRENYRSTQTILDVADSLIGHNNMRINDVVEGIDPHLKSNKGQGDKLMTATLSTGVAETIYIAESIKEKLACGVKANTIAVIYRNNRHSREISETLAKYGIDYLVQGGANILEDSTIRNFLKILRVVYEMRKKEEDEDLFTILHYDIFGIEPLDVLKISRLAGDKRLTLFDVINDAKLLDSLELSSKEKVLSTMDDLAHWNSFDAGNTFTTTFEEILNKSGYLKWVLDQTDSHHRLARLNTLFEEVKKMNRFDHGLDLKGFLENLDLMQENNLRIEENTFGVSEDAVTLTTAHKSKGLEWEHVYIYRAVDGTWGNNKKRDLISLPETLLTNTDLGDKEKNEDERRLFFVATTRAKSSLTISLASLYTGGGTSRESIPTMFLSEIGDALAEEVDVTHIENSAHSHIESMLTTVAPPDTKKDEQSYLTPLVEKFSLSVTALNTYLQCAYKFKLDKLLRVPHAKKPHLAFGTAVHAALESFYQQLKEKGSEPGRDYLLEEFHKALEKEVISKNDLKERRAQGDKVLGAYYDLMKDTFKAPLFLEKFSSVQLDDLPRADSSQRVEAGITLTGKIDRIEWLDKADKKVRVVDYKTGKTKTMGQIEGTTKDSDGDLRRQLVFYKLLIDLDPRLKVSFGEAMLDFVQEPGDKGKDGRRRLTVKDEEVDELKKVIKNAMSEIRALHFPRTTDYKVCKKCYFLDHCWPSGIPHGKY